VHCPYCGFTVNKNPCNNCNEHFIGIEWLDWDENIHENPNQIVRQGKAGQPACNPFKIDKKKGTGIFTGSGKQPYIVSLKHCTCGDFRQRKLPCKHIYRLALELDIFDLCNVYKRYSDIEFENKNYSYDCHDGFRIIGIDRNKQSAIINSYKVNLHECECDYFQKDNKICAHIIQLAIMLRVIGNQDKRGHLWD